MPDQLPALLSGIKPPAMPTFDMFAKTGILNVRTNWETGRVDWDVHVRNDRLMPRSSCHSLLAEIEVANVPAPKPVAARLTKLLLGAWPSRDLTDPEIFASVLSLTFASYPGDVGLQAVDALTRKSKWLPTRCDLIEALDEAMLPRRYAVHVVEKHLERHAELDRDREAEEKHMEERRKRYVNEPWLWLRDSYQVRLRYCADNPDYLAWTKAACQEFGARTVEDWHEQAVTAPRGPAHWYALREFLNQRATKARQEQQP
jgi:hypothetical protein